ncbi:Glutathione transferase [Handroanthus impetiginosus]|uniref:Glutathione S-transferase n=1 Tax=Handroanthus impetiginosus TaxID=429701 RepID=A0A2G9GK15_9LAMI|nr:Glutathione transferase [Handroanthus impetiginosus]
MASGKVKLLGHTLSPYVLRARIALNIKSIEHEFQQEDVLVKKSDLLLKSNPVHKKIPVLIHGGRPICESPVILHYIDEVWTSGPSILPSDPYDRAIARFWCAYIDEKAWVHSCCPKEMKLKMQD